MATRRGMKHTPYVALNTRARVSEPFLRRYRHSPSLRYEIPVACCSGHPGTCFLQHPVGTQPRIAKRPDGCSVLFVLFVLTCFHLCPLTPIHAHLRTLTQGGAFSWSQTDLPAGARCCGLRPPLRCWPPRCGFGCGATPPSPARAHPAATKPRPRATAARWRCSWWSTSGAAFSS